MLPKGTVAERCTGNPRIPKNDHADRCRRARAVRSHRERPQGSAMPFTPAHGQRSTCNAQPSPLTARLVPSRLVPSRLARPSRLLPLASPLAPLSPGTPLASRLSPLASRLVPSRLLPLASPLAPLSPRPLSPLASCLSPHPLSPLAPRLVPSRLIPSRLFSAFPSAARAHRQCPVAALVLPPFRAFQHRCGRGSARSPG